MAIINNQPRKEQDDIENEIEEYLEEPANADKTVVYLYKRNSKKKGYTKSNKRGKYGQGKK